MRSDGDSEGEEDEALRKEHRVSEVRVVCEDGVSMYMYVMM